MRVARFSFLLAAVLLAACEFTAPPDGGKDPADPGLLVDDSLGFRLRIPPGWTGYGPGRPPLRMTLLRDSSEGFRATATVVAGTYPDGVPIPELLKTLREAKYAEHGGSLRIVTEDTLTLAGLPGGVLSYALPGEAGPMQAEQVMVRRGTTLLILTFMELEGRFADRQAEFRAIRESFTFP